MSRGVPYFGASETTRLLGECRFEELLRRTPLLDAASALPSSIAAQHLGRWREAQERLAPWRPGQVFADTGPLVSIIIPTRDRPELLRRALTSVAQQIYRPLEAVVVNDAGGPVSEIVAEIRDALPVVEVVNRENLYLASSRNVGIAHASGHYLGFLDDDDQLYPHHVGHLVGLLRGSPGCRAAASGSLLHDQAARPGRELLSEFQTLPFELEELVRRNVVPVQAVLLESSLLARIGLFDPSLRAQEDWELWLRLRQQTAVAQSFVPTACVDRRHERRMSRRAAPFLLSFDALCARNQALTEAVGGDPALDQQRAQLLELREQAICQAGEHRILLALRGEPRLEHRALCADLPRAVLLPTTSDSEHRAALEAACSDQSVDLVALLSIETLSRLPPVLFPRLAIQLDADPRSVAVAPLDLERSELAELALDADPPCRDPYTAAALLELRGSERGEELSSLSTSCVLLARRAAAGLLGSIQASSPLEREQALLAALRDAGGRLRRSREACLLPSTPESPSLPGVLRALSPERPRSVVLLADPACSGATRALVDELRAARPGLEITLLVDGPGPWPELAQLLRAPVLPSPAGLLPRRASAIEVLRLARALLSERPALAAGLRRGGVRPRFRPGLARLLLADEMIDANGPGSDLHARCLCYLLAGKTLSLRAAPALPSDPLDAELLSVALAHGGRAVEDPAHCPG